jgi:hypothetical protein
VGDAHARLALDPGAVHIILDWYGFGARVLDSVLAELEDPTAAQLWPEHFDLGMSAVAGTGGVNLGASPGDAAVAEPYLYVAPWTGVRPGDPEYWNAAFGAVVTRTQLRDVVDPEGVGAAFLMRGVAMLRGG